MFGIDTGLDIRKASMKSLTAAASAVTEAVKRVLKPKHPVDDDLRLTALG